MKFDYLDTVLTIKWHTGCVAAPKQDCWNKDGKEVGCPPNNFGFSNRRMRLTPPFLNNFAFLSCLLDSLDGYIIVSTAHGELVICSATNSLLGVSLKLL